MKAIKCLFSVLLISLNTMAVAAGANSKVEVDPPIPAPDWSLPAIQNADGTLSMSDYRGRITYVDFLASWVGPCRLSLLVLYGLNSQFADDLVKFLAISIDVV